MDFKNTDIIVVNSPYHDFPLFRKFLIDHHHYFNKVHYVFSYNSHDWEVLKNSLYDYSQIAMSSMPFANFLWSDHEKMNHEGRPDGRLTDYRDVATNMGLDASTSDGILFIEPDIRLDSLDYLLNLPGTFDLVAHCELHGLLLSPSLYWVKRSVIDQTSRWFTSTSLPLFSPMRVLTSGAESNDIPIADKILVDHTPQGGDHWRCFNSQVLGIITNAHLFNDRTYEGFKHYGAIIQTSHNFRQGKYYEKGDFLYNIPQLLDLVNRSLQCGAPLDQRYINEWNTHIANIKAIEAQNSQL